MAQPQPASTSTVIVEYAVARPFPEIAVDNQEIKRRTHVVRIFPSQDSCLRLVRALAVEMHENWLEATRYLNMDHLRDQKKQMQRQAA